MKKIYLRNVRSESGLRAFYERSNPPTRSSASSLHGRDFVVLRVVALRRSRGFLSFLRPRFLRPRRRRRRRRRRGRRGGGEGPAGLSLRLTVLIRVVGPSPASNPCPASSSSPLVANRLLSSAANRDASALCSGGTTSGPTRSRTSPRVRAVVPRPKTIPGAPRCRRRTPDHRRAVIRPERPKVLLSPRADRRPVARSPVRGAFAPDLPPTPAAGVRRLDRGSRLFLTRSRCFSTRAEPGGAVRGAEGRPPWGPPPRAPRGPADHPPASPARRGPDGAAWRPCARRPREGALDHRRGLRRDLAARAEDCPRRARREPPRDGGAGEEGDGEAARGGVEPRRRGEEGGRGAGGGGFGARESRRPPRRRRRGAAPPCPSLRSPRRRARRIGARGGGSVIVSRTASVGAVPSSAPSSVPSSSPRPFFERSFLLLRPRAVLARFAPFPAFARSSPEGAPGPAAARCFAIARATAASPPWSFISGIGASGSRRARFLPIARRAARIRRAREMTRRAAPWGVPLERARATDDTEWPGGGANVSQHVDEEINDEPRRPTRVGETESGQFLTRRSTGRPRALSAADRRVTPPDSPRRTCGNPPGLSGFGDSSPSPPRTPLPRPRSGPSSSRWRLLRMTSSARTRPWPSRRACSRRPGRRGTR